MDRISLLPLLFQNGCSQSSRFQTAGKGERTLGTRLRLALKFWVARDFIILKSKTKEPPKLLSSSGMREGKFISVNNFLTQYLSPFQNKHILNFRVMAVRDITLCSSRDSEPF